MEATIMYRMRWSYAELDGCPVDVLSELVNILNKDGADGDYGG